MATSNQVIVSRDPTEIHLKLIIPYDLGQHNLLAIKENRLYRKNLPHIARFGAACSAGYMGKFVI